MLHSRSWADDRGSAALEFITAGLLLLVPLVYLVLALSAVQAGAMAVEGAARHAARVFVTGHDAVDAKNRAITAVEFALADHGLDADRAAVTVTCTPEPTRCLTRRGLVTVTVQLVVPMPLVPTVFAGNFAIAVPVNATSTQQVSRFWGAR